MIYPDRWYGAWNSGISYTAEHCPLNQATFFAGSSGTSAGGQYHGLPGCLKISAETPRVGMKMAMTQEPTDWRYLPYIRPMFQAYVRGYPHKTRPYRVQYLHFRILKFPLIKIAMWGMPYTSRPAWFQSRYSSELISVFFPTGSPGKF